MTNILNRRQFERLRLTEAAHAVDESGKELGKVSAAGGGGMSIHPASPDVAPLLVVGRRLLVTILEPTTQTAHSIDVIVRFNDGTRVGVEFVTGP